MRTTLKQSCCEFCASLLVIDDGVVTCKIDCELPTLKRPNIQTTIDEMIAWQHKHAALRRLD